jgi:hypothetical protein
MSSLPTELREAADLLENFDYSEELADVASALAALLKREADLQTTMETLVSAGYAPEILLDASKEARALARAIKESIV